MARNYYEVLGVPKDASEKDIQKAYRELARKYHPDLHPDDKDASKKFSEVQEAYDTLNNKEKRKKYDQFGANYEQFQGAPGGGGFGGFGDGTFNMNGQEFDLNDILGRYASGGFGGRGRRSGGFDFGSMFGGRGRRQAAAGGEDVSTEITIPFALAINGGKQTVTYGMSNGQTKTLEITIPTGIADGKKIRLRGLGEPSMMGGTPGDLLITVHVLPHPYFTRQGADLLISLPITLGEAINGAKVDVPTPKGTVALTIPPGTSSGKRLRMKGMGVPSAKGAPAGDLFVEPKIILPDVITDELADLAEKAENGYRTNPRSNMRW